MNNIFKKIMPVKFHLDLDNGGILESVVSNDDDSWTIILYSGTVVKIEKMLDLGKYFVSTQKRPNFLFVAKLKRIGDSIYSHIIPSSSYSLTIIQGDKVDKNVIDFCDNSFKKLLGNRKSITLYGYEID